MAQPNLAFENLANELLQELYELMQKLHQVDFRDQKLIEDCRELSRQYKEALSRAPEAASEIFGLFENLSNRLNHHSLLLTSRGKMAELKSNWKELAETYEQAIRELKKKKFVITQESHLKPVNYYRNAYHVANALIVYVLYTFVLTHKQGLGVLIVCSLAAVTCEIVRKFHPGFNRFMVDKLFGRVSRPQEHFRVNSATWYLLSLTTVMAVAPASAFLMALLTLGLSDPAANIIGKKFGSVKIYREKSWAGSLAFFISSFVVCYAATGLHLMANQSWSFLAPLCLFVALVGTLVELFSTRLDDNMTIIVACTLAAWPFV